MPTLTTDASRWVVENGSEVFVFKTKPKAIVAPASNNKATLRLEDDEKTHDFTFSTADSNINGTTSFADQAALLTGLKAALT